MTLTRELLIEKMVINLMNHNESLKIGDFSVELIVIRRRNFNFKISTVLIYSNMVNDKINILFLSITFDTD